MSEKKPGANKPERKPTALEIAQLAALIDPQACRSGNFRNALLLAVALFEDSADVCGMLAAAENDSLGRDGLLSFGALSGSDGANRLANLYRQRAINTPIPVLTLDTSANTDTCRAYLAKNLNLEGKKKQQEPWKNARTVLDNLKAMFVDSANRANRDNAPRILERERLEMEEAGKQGCTVEQIRTGRLISGDAVWSDGVEKYEDFMRGCRNAFLIRRSGQPSGKSICYDIPQHEIERLIQWRREMKKHGGIKNVRPLTREELFGPHTKRKIPKKPK